MLVIDANPDDAALLQAAAAQVGLRLPFSFITDGLQALAYLHGDGGFADRHAHPFPNVIILDVRLPGLDGFELLQRLRQLPQREALTLLVWSDALEPAFGRRAKEAGADYFVPKFCSFEHLLQQARWFVDLASQTRPARAHSCSAQALT